MDIYYFFHGRKNFFKDNFFWTNSIIFENNVIKKEHSNKKICVIIPARNEEKYIEETLQSIKNQKNPNTSYLSCK